MSLVFPEFGWWWWFLGVGWCNACLGFWCWLYGCFLGLAVVVVLWVWLLSFCGRQFVGVAGGLWLFGWYLVFDCFVAFLVGLV